MAQENGTSTRTSTGIPKSFKVDEHGRSFAKYHDGEVEWIRIGDPLEISALTRSESGGDCGSSIALARF
jgi:hypothetical protein